MDTANTIPTPAHLAMIMLPALLFLTYVPSMIFAKQERVRQVPLRIATITTLVPMIHATRSPDIAYGPTTPMIAQMAKSVLNMISATEDSAWVLSNAPMITLVPKINATSTPDIAHTPSTTNHAILMLQTSAP